MSTGNDVLSDATEFVDCSALPFCRGCGHHLVARHCAAALTAAGWSRPLDVILVTDIGCVGIVDRQFHTHTVHGLHGRSPALAAGLAMALDNPAKKVLVFIGDGGATIGLQHLAEAAHRNIPMTVVVFNNMLYGMTGGQPSGLTPATFNTALPLAGGARGMDLCRIMHALGAPYARRMLCNEGLQEGLTEALSIPGFSLLEVMEPCPSHGVKRNPGRKLKDILAEAGIECSTYRQEARPASTSESRPRPSLLEDLPRWRPRFQAQLDRRIELLIAGSAGEGVQTAAELFAQAAMISGLWATKKGSYPVTVGIGFSTAEIVLSPEPVLFSGMDTPDAALAVSADGLQHIRPRLGKMTAGNVYLDHGLDVPETGATVLRKDFRTPLSSRSAALLALGTLLASEALFPLEAFLEVLRGSKLGARLDVDALAAQATNSVTSRSECLPRQG